MVVMIIPALPPLSIHLAEQSMGPWLANIISHEEIHVCLAQVNKRGSRRESRHDTHGQLQSTSPSFQPLPQSPPSVPGCRKALVIEPERTFNNETRPSRHFLPLPAGQCHPRAWSTRKQHWARRIQIKALQYPTAKIEIHPSIL